MRSFKQYIIEALNYHQRSYVDDITHRHADETTVDTEFSDHLFGGSSSGMGRWDDKDVKTIPFDGKDATTTGQGMLAIMHHLSNSGYKIHDWDKGLAVRSETPKGSKPRPIGIGKVLAATKDKGMETHYDAERAFQTHSIIAPHVNRGLEIMITRSPYHVAEQSTNKAWRSCLTLGTCPEEHQGFIGDDEIGDQKKVERAIQQAIRLGRANQARGENAHKVPGDILGGTHMAYLIRKGDYKLKDPLARISLKPFHSDDIHEKVREYQRKLDPTHPRNYPTKITIDDVPWNDLKPKHTILRRVGKTYRRQEFPGLSNPLISKFEEHVDNLMDEHFPMRDDVFSYQLNHKVQRDVGEDIILKNSDYKHK